jgi:hypothetical protein
MTDEVFREHLLAWIKAIGDALVDQSRAIEALAVALNRQGRQGTLKIKVEAPVSKLRGRRRRLKKALSNNAGV